ncbi:MAG TPA: protein kinase [Acidobacteriota bacterium]|nr:protein kinase [Acidobacteriota bacterium]
MTPEKIGRYIIEREVGSGGMGIVYEASDPVLKRRLAIKVMKPIYAANEDVRKRFLREAEAVAGLQHPNIVAIFDSGGGEDEDQPPFMAMEYIEGHDLEQIRKDESLGLPFERKLKVVAKVARGLEHAHSKNVIHRDIKPGNIRVGEDAVKILDFGVARLTTSSVMTQTGVFLGTFYYASPEHFGKDVDGRSDLFSLGVILYELLTEERPFPGPDYTALINQICIENHPELGEHLPGCDDDLVALVDKALAKKPEDRFQSGTEMARAIESYLESLSQRKSLLRGRLSDMADELHQLHNDFGHHALQTLSQDSDWMKTLAALRVDPEHTVAYDASAASPPEDYGELLAFCQDYRRRLDELNSRENELERLSQLFAASQQQFEQAEWKSCRQTVQQILDDYPENAVALDRLELCEKRIGEVERIESYLEEGQEALEQGRHQEALKRAADVLSLVPDHQEALKLRRQAEQQEALAQVFDDARQAIEQEDWQGALEKAQEGLEQAPENEQLKNFKQRALRGLEEEKELTELLEKAQKRLDGGELEAAIETAQQGLQLRSDHAALIRLVERARRRVERRQRIESLLREARKAEKEQDFEKALSAAGQGLEIEPEHSDFQNISQRCRQRIELRQETQRLTLEGRRHLEQGSPGEAAESFREALELTPEAEDLKQLLAQAEDEQSKLAQRDQMLQNAKVQARKGQWEQSLKAARQGLEAAPDHPPLVEAAEKAQKALARIQELSGMVSQAGRALQAENPKEALETVRQALDGASESEAASLGAPFQELLEQARSLAQKAQREIDLERLRQPVEQARKALAEERFEEALQSAREAQDVDSQSLSRDAQAKKLLDEAQSIAKEAERLIEQQRLDQLLLQASRALEDDRLEEARQAAQEILQARPDHDQAQEIAEQAGQKLERRQRLQALFETAQSALGENKPQEALNAVKEGLRLDPAHEPLREAGQQARKLAKRLEKIKKLRSKAQAALKSREFSQAESLAQEVLDLDSQDQRAEAIRKEARQALREQERLRRLEECLRRAEAAEKKDDLQTCLAQLNEALQLQPDDTELRQRRDEISRQVKSERLFSQARLRQRSGKPGQALPLLDELLTLRPDHSEARQLRQECRQQAAARRRQWMTRLGYAAAAVVALVAVTLLWPMLFTANSADVTPGGSDDLPPALSLGHIYQVQPGETADALPSRVRDLLSHNGQAPSGSLRPGRVIAAGLPQGTVQVGINIQPWAWIESVTRKSDQAGLQLENPIATPVTIPLPPGDYLLKVRHDSWGEGQLDLSVPDRSEFTFSADHPSLSGKDQELERLIKE